MPTAVAIIAAAASGALVLKLLHDSGLTALRCPYCRHELERCTCRDIYG